MKPQFYTLSQKPELFDQAIQLIEEAFHYAPAFSYKEDFLPLVSKSNWSRIVMLLDGQQILAIGGARTLKLQPLALECAFIGGIATHPNHRGQGLGTQIMSRLLEMLKGTPLIMLWSDQISFYERLGFHEFGYVQENIGANWCSEQKTLALNELSSADQQSVQRIYNDYYTSALITPARDTSAWQSIFQMKSVRCSILKEGDLVWGYVFALKGMDLGGLIHEAACLPGYEERLRQTLTPYSYWLRFKDQPTKTANTRFAGLIKVNPNFQISAVELDQVFIPGVDSI